MEVRIGIAKTTKYAMSHCGDSCDFAERPHVLVVAGEGWHPGVIGIVASRVVEKYYRPVVIISLKDGIGKGSCRSIEGFHMRDALQECSRYLLGFGGHAQAAGLSLAADQVDAFRQAMDACAAKWLQPEDYIPVMGRQPPLAGSGSTIPICGHNISFVFYGYFC